MQPRYTPWALGTAPRTAPVPPGGRWRGVYRHAVRWRYAYAVLGSVAIFTVSSFPVRLPAGFSLQDKLFHVIAYFVVGLTYVNAAAPGWPRITVPRALAALAALTLFAISDEVHQAFVPGRVADPADVLADLIGGMAAVGAGLAGGQYGRWAARGAPAATA